MFAKNDSSTNLTIILHEILGNSHSSATNIYQLLFNMP